MTDRTPLIKEVDAPVLVVVEGRTEQRIIFELIRRRQPWLDVVSERNASVTGKPDVRIVHARGRDFTLLAGLGPTIRQFNVVRRLVLVYDAEEEPLETFISIKTSLKGSGFPLPARAWEEAAQGERACAILVLPDGASAGSMEAMLLEAVARAPDGADHLRCVDNYIACVGRDGDVLTARRDKRRLYSWLSVQEEPTRFAGEAAAAGVLPLRTPQLERLADLILGAQT